MKRFFATLLLVWAAAGAAAAQSDIRAMYNFAGDSPAMSLTMESLSSDGAGDTWAEAVFGIQDQAFLSLSSARFEIDRGLNLWKNVPVLGGFSLQAGFCGRMNMDNSSFLAGIGWTAPFKRHLLKAEVLYRSFNGGASASIPLELRLLWRLHDLFGVKGLDFRGQAGAWGEKTSYWYGETEPLNGITGFSIMRANPQIWYSLAAVGAGALSAGIEAELSYNWEGCMGFRVRPAAGVKLRF